MTNNLKFVLSGDPTRKDAYIQNQTDAGWPVGTPEVYEHAIDYDNGFRGCRSGHTAIMDLATERSADSVLIVEDDVIWRDSAKVKYEAALAYLADKEWDGLWLGGHSIQGAVQVTDQGLYKVGKILCCHAYILNGSFIQKCADSLRVSIRSVDNTLMQLVLENDSQIYALMPSVAGQSEGWSPRTGKYRSERWDSA